MLVILCFLSMRLKIPASTLFGTKLVALFQAAAAGANSCSSPIAQVKSTAHSSRTVR